MARFAVGLLLALGPSAAEACATCISSAYGDRTFNWAFLSLLGAPFVISVAIGSVLYVNVRRQRAARDESSTTTMVKETT